MTAIIYRPRSRAEVVRLLAEREEIEECRAAYSDWNSGRPLAPMRWQDRAVIVVITTAGCGLWLLEIARLARGVWWR
jgi:hypothetical protein